MLNNLIVIKRSGKEIKYNNDKIKKAIIGANKDVNNIMSEEDIDKTISLIEKYISKHYIKKKRNKINVEDIQDIVEKKLMSYVKFHPVAKAYIIYRQQHAVRRKAAGELMDSYHDLLFTDSQQRDLKRDNANINCDGSMGIMLKLGSEGAKTYAMEYVLDKDIREAHRKHVVHLHKNIVAL